LEHEGVSYNEEAVDIIISLADGGMRDALSILDQVLAYSGNKLDVQDILDIFALESKEEKIALLNAIIQKDVSNVLQRINRYVSLGTDIKRLTDDLLLILKDILIYQSSRNVACLEVLNEQEAQSFFKYLDIDETLKMIDIIMAAQKDYKNVSSIIPLFQVTILKLITAKKDGMPEPVQEIKKPEPVISKPLPKPEPAPAKVAEPAPKKQVKQEELISLLDQPEPEPEPVKQPEIVLSKDVLVLKDSRKEDSFFINDDLMIDIIVTAKKDIKNHLLEHWSDLKRLIAHPKLGKAATLLVDGRPLVASNRVLVVEYQFPNTAERANLIENQENIQNVIQSTFGKKMFVYGLSRSESVRCQQNFINKRQLGTLPKIDTINIEFEGEN
jgi:DNA polymerase-3 subunit gamma/tau